MFGVSFQTVYTMEKFDSNKSLGKIIKEFKRTDEFYNSFRERFIVATFFVIKRYYKQLKLDEEMDRDIRLYADEMLSCVESVIYKDLTYPEERLEEEVKVMTRIVQKDLESFHNMAFIEKLHVVAKEQIVTNFPQIMDLSANGFRLLERYSKLYNWEFITNFHKQIEK